MRKRKQFETPPRRVALFVTCMVDMLYPDVGMAAVDLLEREGVDVVFPYEQTCCGQPAFNAGYRDEARALAVRYLDVFEPFLKEGLVDAIVTPSGSCAGMVTHFYSVLFEDPMMQTNRLRAEALAEVTFELTEFLVDVLGVTDTGSEFQGKLTYHASCHNLREMEVDRQPRALLEHVEGAELVELAGDDECCGFGGLFAIKNAEISTAMGQRKCVNLAQTDADVVTLCDVSCMTHINGLLERQGQHIRAVHIAEILNQRPPEEETVEPAESEPEPIPEPPPSSVQEPAQVPLPEKEEDPDSRSRRCQDIR